MAKPKDHRKRSQCRIYRRGSYHINKKTWGKELEEEVMDELKLKARAKRRTDMSNTYCILFCALVDHPFPLVIRSLPPSAPTTESEVPGKLRGQITSFDQTKSVGSHMLLQNHGSTLTF